MERLLAVVIVLTLLSGWSCAQVPGDADAFCTETLPSIGVNILDYPPEVKPLMDSCHHQQLLPPNTGAVWQTVDNDNNNPSNIRTSVICCTSYILVHLQGSHKCYLMLGDAVYWKLGLPWTQSQAFPCMHACTLCKNGMNTLEVNYVLLRTAWNFQCLDRRCKKCFKNKTGQWVGLGTRLDVTLLCCSGQSHSEVLL